MTKAFKSFLIAILFCPFVGAEYKNSKNQDLIIHSVVYGKSFLGKKLIGYKIYRTNHVGPRSAAVITGGVHGNEYMGIIEEIPNLLATSEGDKRFDSFFKAGGVLFVVPKVNPDGVQKQNRYSILGKDLNRDFDFNNKGKFLEQQESFYLVKWVEHELTQMKAQLVLALDYHCCANALIYPDVQSGGSKSVHQNFYQNVFSSLKKNISRDFKMGITKQIFGNSTNGTLKDYWYSQYGAASFTYEGGKPSTEIKYFNQHVSWWEDILHSVTNLSSLQLAELKQGAGTSALAELRKQSFKAYSE